MSADWPPTERLNEELQKARAAETDLQTRWLAVWQIAKLSPAQRELGNGVDIISLAN